MVVSTTDYGNLVTHEGTLAEVMGALKGKPASSIINVFYNGTNTTAVAKKV